MFCVIESRFRFTHPFLCGFVVILAVRRIVVFFVLGFVLRCKFIFFTFWRAPPRCQFVSENPFSVISNRCPGAGKHSSQLSILGVAYCVIFVFEKAFIRFERPILCMILSLARLRPLSGIRRLIWACVLLVLWILKVIRSLSWDCFFVFAGWVHGFFRIFLLSGFKNGLWIPWLWVLAVANLDLLF